MWVTMAGEVVCYSEKIAQTLALVDHGSNSAGRLPALLCQSS